MANSLISLVPPAGLEPATPGLGILCSILTELRGHRHSDLYDAAPGLSS